VLGESPPAVVCVGKVGPDPNSEEGGSVLIERILPTAETPGNPRSWAVGLKGFGRDLARLWLRLGQEFGEWLPVVTVPPFEQVVGVTFGESGVVED